MRYINLPVQEQCLTNTNHYTAIFLYYFNNHAILTHTCKVYLLKIGDNSGQVPSVGEALCGSHFKEIPYKHGPWSHTQKEINSYPKLAHCLSTPGPAQVSEDSILPTSTPQPWRGQKASITYKQTAPSKQAQGQIGREKHGRELQGRSPEPVGDQPLELRGLRGTRPLTPSSC